MRRSISKEEKKGSQPTGPQRQRKCPKTHRKAFLKKTLENNEALRGKETKKQYNARRIKELLTLATTKMSNGFEERERVLEGKGLLFEQLQQITNRQLKPAKAF